MDPPGYADYPSPKAGTDEVLVRVSASALSQLVRAQASGKHYSSGRPPLVPGVDGVGYLEDGRRVYFAFPLYALRGYGPTNRGQLCELG